MNEYPGNTRDRAAQSIVVECELPQRPEMVWRALTKPELLAAWLMPNDVPSESRQPRIGDRFTFRPPPAVDGHRMPIECEVLAAEPNRLLRYSWRTARSDRDAEGRPLDSIVTFELTETSTGGTRLRLVHSGFSANLHGPVALLAGSGAARASTLRLPVRRRSLDLRYRRRLYAGNRNARAVMRWAA